MLYFLKEGFAEIGKRMRRPYVSWTKLKKGAKYTKWLDRRRSLSMKTESVLR